MTTLLRENVNEHCRTCLTYLKNTGTDGIVLPVTTVSINSNMEVQQLLEKYIDQENSYYNAAYPQYLCADCCNTLQAFERFCQRAKVNAEKLQALLNGVMLKVEIADEQPAPDIYKFLFKDTLMEKVLLDNTTAPNLSSIEMQAPDPFSTTNDTGQQAEEPLLENNNLTKKEKSKIKRKKSERLRQNEEEQSLEEVDLEANVIDNVMEKEKTYGRRKRSIQRELQQEENKIRNKGTKNNFKCTQCNHCFVRKITLDAHVRKVHEGSKRPFQCDRCDKAYTFIGGLYTHIKEIHEAEVRSYRCDEPNCERIYTSFIAMQKHKRLKHSEVSSGKKYVCEQCGATYNQSGNLKYHRRAKHPTEAELAERERDKQRYECQLCQKLFHSRYTLKYHTLQLHGNDMQYVCSICGRRMAKKFMLVQHMLVHSTEKMPCEHCGKQFVRKFELEAHIRAVHMKLKPFECQYCQESFASRKTLRHHVYIHTGEKPYVCNICGQAYRQQTCLKNHRKAHEKLTNFLPQPQLQQQQQQQQITSML